MRHVLCAESDEERDSWVSVLVRYVSGKYSPPPHGEEMQPSSTEGPNAAPVGSTNSGTGSSPRAVFGVPIQETLAVAQIANLPAIVFRCIQYLETKHAEHEEGIYRITGSSAVIKALKDRFNAGTCHGNCPFILTTINVAL
jgi:hypothetical protein